MKSKTNQHIGSNFDDFLREEGIYEEVEAAALKKVNSEYKGGGTFHAENGQLTYVHLYGHHEITDIAPLRGIPITSLSLGNCDGITDYSPLEGMPLKELDVGTCRNFDDQAMAYLRGAPLERLVVEFTSQTDISVIKGTRMRCLRVERADDLSGLAGMSLEELLVRRAERVEDISVIRGMPLVLLRLGGLSVTNFSALVSLHSLRSLDLSGSREFSDLTLVAKMKDLEELLIPKTAVEDLAPLKALGHLKKLDIGGTPVVQLTPILDLKLADFTFDPRNIKDPAQLKSLRSLKSLQRICGKPAAEFWKRYDAGEFK